MIEFAARFEVGDFVLIAPEVLDTDAGVTFKRIVTGVLFRHAHRVLYEVSWVATDGEPRCAWVEDFRCVPFPKPVKLGDF